MRQFKTSPKIPLVILIVLVLVIGLNSVVLACTIGNDGWSGGTAPTMASSVSMVSAAGTYSGKAVFTATLMDGVTPLVRRPIHFSLNGKRLGVAFTDSAGVARLTRKLKDQPAGTYADAVSAYFAGDKVYMASTGTGTLTVVKKDIVVTVKNKRRLIGTENPPLTYYNSGKVRKDAIPGITLATTATIGSPVGTYPITVSGPASTDNYNITYMPGILSVVLTMEIKSIEISGSDSVTIPLASEETWGHFGGKHRGVAVFKATAFDENGIALPSRGQITWSLLAPVMGVEINAEKGIVTVISTAVAGSFTVVATSGTITASKTVALVVPAIVPVTSVVMKKSTLTVYVGHKTQLTAKVLPRNATNKAVTWSSSDPLIATVDVKGKVTGVSVGTAVITVTTADGAFTATCTVTVENAPIHEDHHFGNRHRK